MAAIAEDQEAIMSARTAPGLGPDPPRPHRPNRRLREDAPERPDILVLDVT
jgi:hypothetical protein